MERIGTSRSLSEKAASAIRREILDGAFEQGFRLMETRVAAELGISRGPVREAFKLLRAEGLLREETNRGTFVVSLSTDDIREIFEVRVAVETRAVKLITRASREADLKELHESSQRLIREACHGQAAVIAKADLAFHETLCRLSGVRRLHEIFMRHAPLVQSLLQIDEYLYPVLADLSDEHEGIVRAIESHDDTAAVAAIESHLEHARDRDIAYLEIHPGQA